MRQGLLISLLLLTASAWGQTLARPVYHQAKYNPMSCEFASDPEPTNSPNPLPVLTNPVVLDFIIGYDGRVSSPLVLQSDGTHDQMIVKLVRTWRYHPGTCNKIPINVEAVVVFVP